MAGDTTAVGIEAGRKRVFAWALDWPGWCRAGRDERLALEALAAYLPRYASVVERAGLGFPPDRFEVVERLAGRSSYTDFGVPGAVAASDARPLDDAEAGRLTALVEAAWATFASVSRSAPAELRRGPRGGGRDRDRMIEHVLGAEAAYARKLGVRHRQPAIHDGAAIRALRADIAAALVAGRAPEAASAWPPRYAARRIAWHVLDHAWEMEDRSRPG